MTGAPLEVTIRFQANLLVQPVEELSLFQEVPRIFMPAMWFEQKFSMDEAMARKIKIAVQIPWIGRIAGLVLLGVGIVFVIISTMIACLQSKRAKRQQMETNFNDGKVDTREKKEVSPLLTRQFRPQITQHKRDLTN